MLVLIHKECGGPAMENSPVGEVCAIPSTGFPFPASVVLRILTTNRKSGCQKNPGSNYVLCRQIVVKYRSHLLS